MKKSLIALAVAGAFAAPAAFAASANVDVYGIMNIAIQDTDVKGTDMEVVDNVSRVGLKGSEDLGGGLKAVWQIESAIGDGVNGVGTGSIGGRNTFVGLAGGFGTFIMGRHDTPYKLGTLPLDIFGDTIADYNTGRLDGVQLLNDTHDHRSPQAIAYISPTWSGFHFAVAGVAASGNGIDSGDTVDAWSATGVYANGPLFASLSYQTVDLLDSDAWKLGVSYAFGDTTVGFAYENIDQAADRDSWLINVKHNMGPITLKAQYGQVDNNGADETQLALGVDYAMSKRTTAYFVIGQGDNDVGSDVTGWNLGIKHSF
jgi:predicted porin